MVAQREMASTRETYGRTLLELADTFPDLVVLGGDLNVSVFTHLWRDQYPDRFFDFGPAEQNMVGVGAGLAASGKIPFVSTFAVFGVGRPFDQLRVLVAQSHLNLKLVCTHAGIMTGEDGMSAHGIEDLALACSLAGFTVVVPADSPETAQAVRAAAETDGPFYIRLSRAATPVIHDGSYKFEVGRAETLRQGQDLTIIATGVMTSVALDAAELLAQSGVQARVLHMGTMKPTDEAAIIAAARETGAIVTAEEHYIHGGLGSIVGQVVGRHHPVPLEMVALQGYAVSGKAEELMVRCGLSPEHVRAAADAVLSRKKA
jgi:transketolase